MLAIRVIYKSDKKGERVICQSFYGNHIMPYDYAASRTFASCADKAFDLIKKDLNDKGMDWADNMQRSCSVSIPGGDDILVIYK